MRKARFLTILLLAWPLTPAASATTLTDPFALLFGNTCMLHFYSQDKLRAEMSATSMPELSPDRAAFFLANRKGTAWSVKAGSTDYVVALRDDNFCAVYAREADVQAVPKDFELLVSKSPPPLVSGALAKSFAGPNTDVLSSVAYGWSRPGDEVQLVFTLTISSETAPMVKAMASVALSKKPNNSFKPKPLRGSA